MSIQATVWHFCPCWAELGEAFAVGMEAGDWLAGADRRGSVEAELITTTGLSTGPINH